MSSVALAFVATIAVRTAPRGAHADRRQSGTFVIGSDQLIGGQPVDAAYRPAAQTLAQTVRDIVARNSAVASPSGFSVRIHRVMGRRTDWAHFDSGLPFFAGAVGVLFSAGARPSATAWSAPNFGIYVNTVLQCPVSTFSLPNAHGAVAQVDGMPIIEGGRRTGDFRGHPVYDTDCIILTRGSRAPFIAVTRERYRRLEIDAIKGQLEEVRKQRAAQASNAALQSALQEAETEIAKLIAQRERAAAAESAADRARPAFVRPDGAESPLANPDEDGAIPLSTPNPALFDRSLPPSAVQVVSVYLPFAQSGARANGLPPDLGEEWRPIEERIRDQFDWSAIAALLQQ